MQTQKQTSGLNLTNYLFFSLLAMLFLFSCSKEKDRVSGPEKAELSTNKSAQPSNQQGATDVPYDWNIFVPCANGGAGEWVHVTGSTHIVYTISWTDYGFTYGYHANTYQIKGVGLTSGETFIGSGNTEGQVLGAWVNEQWLSTFVDQLRLIGQNTSFTVRTTYHVTVNPDGDVEVNQHDHEVICE
jgi:hypothetical protein